jgi:hypothetical protein
MAEMKSRRKFLEDGEEKMTRTSKPNNLLSGMTIASQGSQGAFPYGNWKCHTCKVCASRNLRHRISALEMPRVLPVEDRKRASPIETYLVAEGDR